MKKRPTKTQEEMLALGEEIRRCACGPCAYLRSFWDMRPEELAKLNRAAADEVEAATPSLRVLAIMRAAEQGDSEPVTLADYLDAGGKRRTRGAGA